jgi:tetratricopeptide (TPR) repeat protein
MLLLSDLTKMTLLKRKNSVHALFVKWRAAISQKNLTRVWQHWLTMPFFTYIGALGYGAVKGVAAGGRAVKGAVGNHSGKRFRNGVKRLHKGIMKSLGRDTLDKYIQELTTQINVPGSSPQLHQQRAAVHFAAMKYAEALQDLQIFLQHEPKNIIALFTFGYINSLLESFEEADKHFHSALVRAFCITLPLLKC